MDPITLKSHLTLLECPCFPRNKPLKTLIASATAAILFALTLISCGPRRDIPLPATGDEHIVNGVTIGGATYGGRNPKEEVKALEKAKKEPLAQNVVALLIRQSAGEGLCTGTILDEETILTAAHCVDEKPRKILVIFATKIPTRLGMTGRNRDSISDELSEAARNESQFAGHAGEDVTRTADRFVQHPTWASTRSPVRIDLALVHFSGGLPPGYKPIQFASPRTEFESGTPVRFLGYGVTSGTRKSGSGQLRETDTKILSQVSSAEFLSDGRESGVCFGDSGGPAFIHERGQWVQWGVASAVTNRACNSASIHTSVLSFLPWLRSTAKQLAQN